MGKTITVEPVSRIEGHAKITVNLDDAGKLMMHTYTSLRCAASRSFYREGLLRTPNEL